MNMSEALPEQLDSGWRQAFKRAQLQGELDQRRAAAMDQVSLEQLRSVRRDDPTAFGNKAKELKHLGSLREAFEESSQIATSDLRTLHDLEEMTDPDNANATQEKLEHDRKLLVGQRLKAALVRDKVSLAQSAKYRIINAYRITKELARIVGDASAEETLAESLVPSKKNPDPWLYPTYVKSTIEEIHRTRKTSSVALIKRIELMQKFFRVAVPDTSGTLHQRSGGVVYSPPSRGLRVYIETKHRQTVTDLAIMYYGLSNDFKAIDFFKALWHEIVKDISETLYLQRGSKRMPELGEFGLVGLFDPQFSGSLWPPRHELIQFEELLLEEIQTVYMEEGQKGVKKVLRDKYGFLQHEEQDVYNLMLYKTRDHVIDDIEIHRAKTLLRLEKLIEKTSESGDTRAELAAIKQQAQITGLYQDTGAETMDDFIDAMSSISKERDIEEGIAFIEE